MIPSGGCFGFASASFRESLSEVTKLVQTELQGLLKRRSAIRRRAHRLRQGLHGLQQGAGGYSLYKLCSELPISQRQRALERQATRNVMQPRVRPPSNDACGNLRRARQIALMEAGGEASPEQIYSYISRSGGIQIRGSIECLPYFCRIGRYVKL